MYSRKAVSGVFGVPVLAVMAVAGQAPAAAAQGVAIHPGLEAGINLATANGDVFSDLDGVAEKKRKKGLVAGGFIEIALSPRFSLQPEVLYSEKGLRITAGDLDGDARINLKYLEVPLLAKVHLLTSGSVRPFLAAGPTVGIRLSARTKFSFAGESSEEDLGDEVTKTDLGVMAGGGVTVPLGGARLTLDGRYTWGLRTIDSALDGTDDVKNRVLSFLVGLSFQ